MPFLLLSATSYTQSCKALSGDNEIKFEEINAPLAIGVCSAELANNLNNPELQAMLGRAYDKAEDYEQAIKLWQTAAEQGDANAQNSLAWMYENGRGVEQDDVKAVEWYKKAAAQGFAKAQYNVGVMYFHGQGVKKDSAQAKKWFAEACASGYTDACPYK